MEKFQVLGQFQSAVSACEVSLGAGGTLELSEGLDRAVEMLKQVRTEGRKVVIIGNGGSAAIASHQAVDLWRNGGLRATAFNDATLLTCVANDFGYGQVFAHPIGMFCDSGDLVIAISSSGNSQNILQAVAKARELNCAIIGFSGFSPINSLRRGGDLNFYVPSTSYGVVEVAHLLLIHSVVDEFIRHGKESAHESRNSEKSLFENAPHS